MIGRKQKPVFHGRDHRWGGADPDADHPWCYIQQTTPVTIASDGVFHPIDIQEGVSGSFFTSDPSVFENDFRTIGGVDYHGIKIKAGGWYEIEGDGKWSGLSAAAIATAYWTRQDGGADSSALSVFQSGRVAALGNDTWDQNLGVPHTSFKEFLNIPGGGIESLDGFGPYDATPVKITLEAKQSGTGSPTVVMSMYVTRRGRNYYSNAGTIP